MGFQGKFPTQAELRMKVNKMKKRKKRGGSYLRNNDWLQ